MSEHAHVKLGEFSIPLIGVPKDATQIFCDFCMTNKHLSEMNVLYDGRSFICRDCLKERRLDDAATPENPT